MNNSRKTIILVDDNMTDLMRSKDILKTFYKVYAVPSAVKFFEILKSVHPDLILLDIEMPDMNGYQIIKKLKADSRYADIPVIFLTSKSDESSELEGFNLGAADYITKPFSSPLLHKRISNQLLIANNQTDLKNYTENLEKTVQEKSSKIQNIQTAILAILADIVEFRDKYTGGHIIRTQSYIKILIEALIHKEIYMDEIATWDMDSFLPSVLLHDVGKIAISGDILNKPGKLTSEEFEIIKTHVNVGIDTIDRIIHIVHDNAFLQHTLSIAGTHHEKWDGTGYLVGLKGTNIPLEGRLMAIADVYDALITERTHKKACTHEEAKRIIEEGSGTHFDPVLVDVFSDVSDDLYQIVLENKDLE